MVFSFVAITVLSHYNTFASVLEVVDLRLHDTRLANISDDDNQANVIVLSRLIAQLKGETIYLFTRCTMLDCFYYVVSCE